MLRLDLHPHHYPGLPYLALPVSRPPLCAHLPSIAAHSLAAAGRNYYKLDSDQSRHTGSAHSIAIATAIIPN